MASIAVDANGCWLWLGALTDEGYGVMRGCGQTRAHRVTYVLFVGDVPKGLHLDHLCRVRRCVNPDHLEPVTPLENQRRSPISMATVNSSKTHCKHGHEFNEANTGIEQRTPTLAIRYCKACKRGRERAARKGA